MDTSTGPAREVWRVGDLVIDVGRQRVSRGERTIELPKLSFDLLLALVRAAPNVLSTDALLTQVWPGLVVNPETVVQRVKLLRDALDDRAADSGYVIALRGRGYRLAGDAVRLDEPGAHVDRPDAAGSARWNRRTTAILTAAVVLLIGAATFWIQSRDRAPAATPAGDASTDARLRTVAVLPFKNLGADSADTFMSVAVPDVILSRLASSPELTVVARDSAFRVDAQSRDPAEVGRRLGASFLVEGTVQTSGDALRVTARLIDADTQRQLWSARFDRPVADLFAMQNEIAEQVATALGQRVMRMKPLSPATAPTANSAAYLAYLRGRTLIDRYTAVQAEAAATEFERAIELDRDFAAAHVGLYDARMQAAAIKFDDIGEARRRNRPLLERAMALDPDSAAVLFARAMWDDLGDEEREKLFREALRRDPGNSRGLIAFVDFLMVIEGMAAEQVRGSGVYTTRYPIPAQFSSAREVEIKELLARAIEIDPLSAPARYRQLNMEAPGREQSELTMEGLLALDPRYYPALHQVAWVRWLFRDSPSQAITLIEKAIAIDPENPVARMHAVPFYLDIDDEAAAADVASATRASATSAVPILALAAGDWRRASAAARRADSYVIESIPSLGPYYALRDGALRTGDYGDAERLLCETFGMSLRGPVEVSLWNFRPWVLLAHLQLVQGRKVDAQRMLDAVIAWIDADRIYGPVANQRTRAQALMLLGRRDEALRALATSFHVDRDHVDWWYTLRRDPVFDEVRGTPEFQALAPDVQRFVAREQAAVESLRQRGEIPRRPDPIPNGASAGR